ncbi:MAG: M13-type metalloendopeptidase [bacterium]
MVRSLIVWLALVCTFPLGAKEAKHNNVSLQEKLLNGSCGRDLQKWNEWSALFLQRPNVLNALSFKALSPVLESIRSIEDFDSLIESIVDLQSRGFEPLFVIEKLPDLQGGEIYTIRPAEFGLPDPQLYNMPTIQALKIRSRYQKTGQSLMRLVQPYFDRGSEIDFMEVFDLESDLAEKMNEIPRQLKKIVQGVPVAQADKLTPNLFWSRIFSDLGLNPDLFVNLLSPAYFEELDNKLVEVDVELWKDFLFWRVVNELAPILSEQTGNLYWKFYNDGWFEEKPTSQAQQSLLNLKKYQPERLDNLLVQCWKAENDHSEKVLNSLIVSLSQLRVSLKKHVLLQNYLNESEKKQATEIINKIEVEVLQPLQGFADGIESLPDFILNEKKRSFRQKSGQLQAQQASLHQYALDAVFDPLQHKIFVPVELLNLISNDPVLFDIIVGHEIWHAIADQGSHLDSDGRLVDWWSVSSTKKYRKLSKSICKGIAVKEDCTELMADYHSIKSILSGVNKEQGEVILERWTHFWLASKNSKAAIRLELISKSLKPEFLEKLAIIQNN